MLNKVAKIVFFSSFQNEADFAIKEMSIFSIGCHL
jgi:hypothetical protein